MSIIIPLVPLVPCSNRNKKATETTNHILKHHSLLNTLGSKFLSMVSFYTFYILQFYPYQAFDIFNKSIKYEMNCQVKFILIQMGLQKIKFLYTYL